MIRHTFYGVADLDILRAEIIAAIGNEGWFLNGAVGEVTFVATDENVPDPTATIEAHIVGALGRMKAKLVAEVDNEIAAIQGKWGRFEAEYRGREAAGRAYKAGGYVGVAPKFVNDYAVEVDKTDKEAADIIIMQADGMLAVLETLGGIRMRKNRILKAVDEAEAIGHRDAILAAAKAEAAKIK